MIIVTSNPLKPILDGVVQVGGRPWAVAITDKGTGNISDDTVFASTVIIRELVTCCGATTSRQ
jgi:hypothetical protein